jgi:WD40 repeat protein
LERSSALISSSKDTLIKVWDLETQHCTQTVVGHRKEIWSFAVNQEETRLYSSAADNQLRVFNFKYSEENPTALPELEQIGSIPRESKDRVSLKFFHRNL